MYIMHLDASCTSKMMTKEDEMGAVFCGEQNKNLAGGLSFI